MIEDVKKVIVKYNGKTVGYLADIDGEIGFQYDVEWLKTGFNISPFSLPLEDKIFISKKDAFGGLYGVFYDSLPDGWGELLVRRMLAKRGINADALSPIVKLSLINGQGLGGLNYEPCQAETEQNILIELDELAGEVEKILNDETDDKGLDAVFRLGASSGGARPKAHIKVDGEEWIVKFPCRYDPEDAGVKEYNANILAQKCGLTVNECRLFKSDACSGYFGAKRFDRTARGRVHMISLSSLLETSHRIPNLDYIHLFQVVQRICVDQNDLYEAFGRMCFNVFYGNKDDHGKNFAFLYDEQVGGYRLSPFYDVTRTKDKFEHEMTVNGAGNPTESDMLEAAVFMKLSKARCRRIIENIKSVLSQFGH